MDYLDAEIRHINLSGGLYSRLVFGEEEPSEGNYFQTNPFEDPHKHNVLFQGSSVLEPRFRDVDPHRSYVYVVSLWGNVDLRRRVLDELARIKRKHHQIAIVGYWADPAFDMSPYDGYSFDLLVQSVAELASKWATKGVKTVHVPVASLNVSAQSNVTHDAFSVGTATDLRLAKIVNSERQFRANDIDCYWCIAGPGVLEHHDAEVSAIQRYREFPDRVFMPPDETLSMASQVNVMLNISRLPDSYQTNPSYYAIMFNKKLLIDSDMIRDSAYFDSRFMKVVDFTGPAWLTPDLADWMKTTEEIDYGYDGEWEPRVFYRNIRQMLEESSHG